MKNFLLTILILNCFGLDSGTVAAATEQIKPGDKLHIVVYDHKELSRRVVVDDAGRIDFPFFNDTPVIGMSTGQLQEVLTLRLSNYIERPIVLVDFTAAFSIEVKVLGQVTQPGNYLISTAVTLQEVLSLAGGPTDLADLNSIQIHRLDKTIKVSLAEFLRKGEPGYLPELADGDVIILPTRQSGQNIKIIGEVAHPGEFPYYKGMTLVDLIYLAGGPTPDADLNDVLYLKKSADLKTRHLNLKNIIDHGRVNEIPDLAEGDIVIIKKQKKFWTKFMGITRDVVLLVTLGLTISQISK